jgi:argininosuccinate lyase
MTKLWGGRFAEEPNQQMKILNDSISFDIQFYAVDIAGSLAYASAIHAAELINDAEVIQIQDGLERVLAEFESDTFELKDGDEDIHTAVERRLKELIGEAAGKLHTGRSRNDQIATDLRLWLVDSCGHVQSMIRDLQAAFIMVAEPHLETVMPGYTHFQPAQPITAAHWLMSFFWMLQRDHERFEDCAKRVNYSPLGSSALAGTPYPIDREALADDLGFAGVTENSLDGVSDRDGVAEFLFAASLLGTHLSRFAEDIVIYANPSLGFVKLPDAYSTGSSIMPQKRNPDPMELTRGKSGRMIGNLTGLLATLKGLPSGYNKDLQEDKEPLFDTIHTLEMLLPVMTGMLGALKFNPNKLRAALDEGLLATELADYLVAKGLAFREGHHIVGQIVQASEQQNKPLSQLSLESYQSISPLFEKDVFEWLNFEAAVSKRTARGGTSPAAVKKQIELAKGIMEA